jgi:outer membrane protein TolC
MTRTTLLALCLTAGVLLAGGSAQAADVRPPTSPAAEPAAAPAPGDAPEVHAAAPTPLPAGTDEAPAARRMSLAACIRTAWEKHPDVQRVRVSVERAADEARATRGAYGPTLTAEANVLVWDEELTSSFGGGGAAPDLTTMPMPTDPFDLWLIGTLAPLLESFSSMGSLTIRDQVTWGVTLRLTQPLTPLWRVYHGYEARQQIVAQQQVRGQTVQSDIALNVATAYYGALQAGEYVLIAQSAVDQLRAHLGQAQAFFENGVIGKNDVLKVAVELANAEQQVIQAQAGRAIAEANLAAQMGLSTAAPVAPEEDRPVDESVPLPPVDLSLEGAVREAIDRRTELVEIGHGIAAADHGAQAAWWALMPDVVLVAQYAHTGGQGTFAKEDTFFAGLMLSWDIWQWGQTYYAAEAADGSVEELRLQRERLEQLLQLDVTARYHLLRSAEKAFQVSVVAISQAEEALRIERERFGAQVATSTDVLDAEAALTRAKANRVNTYYAYLLARAELLRAMGRPLLADASSADAAVGEGGAAGAGR